MPGQSAEEKTFTLSLYAERPQEPCALYTSFSEWAGKSLRAYTEDPSHESINQAYLLLLQKYMEYYATATKRCRESVGSRGHRCIHHVLMETYQGLRRTELELVPLPLPGQAQARKAGAGGTLIGLPPVPGDEHG